MKNMKALMVFLLVVVALVASSGRLSASGCANCNCQLCYFACYYHYDYCCTSKCHTCFCAGPAEASYLDSLHPGFFVREASGHEFVQAVFDGVPTSEASLLSGDEVVQVNPIGSQQVKQDSCGPQTWQIVKSDPKATLTIRRANVKRQVTVPLISIRTLLDRSWMGETPEWRAKALDGGTADRYDQRVQMYGPYIFGLRWSDAEEHVVVTGVLRGSPAYSAGISPGDKIVAINSIRLTKTTRNKLDQLFPSDYRTEVGITFLHGGAERTVTLVNQGLSRIFRQTAYRPETPGTNLAQTTAGPVAP